MARLPKLDISLDNVRTAAVPAMAIGGLVGIVGVFVGLQCGGLDRCLAGPAKPSAPIVEVAVAIEEPAAEPRLLPDSALALTVATVAAPAAEVAVASLEEPAAKQVQDVIGDTFSAIASDDQGWLTGKHSAPVADEPAPMPQQPKKLTPVPSLPAPVVASVGGQTAVEAVAAATREADALPLDRPKPLTMNAFVEERSTTDARAKAAAEKKLAEVTGKAAATPQETKVATALAVDPEPKATAKQADPVKKLADVSGDSRTVGGSGVSVRSGPGKSYGRKFALAAGEKVKVGGTQRGWLQITDDQGRTGWAYKTYFN